MTNIYSLGSACHVAIQLKRLGKSTVHYFFDYLWNHLDGLTAVTKIIESDFAGFDNIANYTKTVNHPILNWNAFNICANYPNVVFMHHDTTKQDIIDSISRKITRTKEMLSSTAPKIFVYYRPDTFCKDFQILIAESTAFCEMYHLKYNSNFVLLSLISYSVKKSDAEIEHDMAMLSIYENENLKFDHVYCKNLNKYYDDSWNIINKKYFK